jgi:anti-sigma regulatory factor (Ser/Thr protein kinase)
MEVRRVSPRAGLRAREQSANELTMRLPLDVWAPSAARAGIRERLRGLLTDSELNDLELLVSELVANSLLHSGAGTAGVVVRVGLSDDALRLAVEDAGRGGPIAARPPDRRRGGGFGLQLVDAISERWGVERDAAHGTRVWARLSRDR